MKSKKMSKIGCHSSLRRPTPMLTTIEINQLFSLHQLGKSINAIHRQTGHSRTTIRRYLQNPSPISSDRTTHWLISNQDSVRELFFTAEGNCVVLQRLLADKFAKEFSIRCLQRFCRPFREELEPTTAFTRYETAPGHQMQIDFGERDVLINGQSTRIHFIVCILGFSRRIFAKAYPSENQAAWLNGIESAFQFFGGVPLTILSDNSRCLVTEHRQRGETKLTSGYRYFCDYWRVKPIASTPYHPQSKGKVERAVRYIKENALVGKTFDSLQDINLWLETWSRTHADLRRLEDFAEGLKTPKERFWLEQNELQPLDGKPMIASLREEIRHVDGAGLIRVDNKFYRLPDSVANYDVQILVDDKAIVVTYGGKLIAELDKASSVYQPKPQNEEDDQLEKTLPALPQLPQPFVDTSIQRSLSVYATIAGGNF